MELSYSLEITMIISGGVLVCLSLIVMAMNKRGKNNKCCENISCCCGFLSIKIDKSIDFNSTENEIREYCVKLSDKNNCQSCTCKEILLQKFKSLKPEKRDIQDRKCFPECACKSNVCCIPTLVFYATVLALKRSELSNDCRENNTSHTKNASVERGKDSNSVHLDNDQSDLLIDKQKDGYSITTAQNAFKHEIDDMGNPCPETTNDNDKTRPGNSSYEKASDGFRSSCGISKTSENGKEEKNVPHSGNGDHAKSNLIQEEESSQAVPLEDVNSGETPSTTLSENGLGKTPSRLLSDLRQFNFDGEYMTIYRKLDDQRIKRYKTGDVENRNDQYQYLENHKKHYSDYRSENEYTDYCFCCNS